MHRREKGTKGELVALDALTSKGLHLIEKNYNCDFGELDLIMQDQAEIVFVEVKSLVDDPEVSILETVSEIKLGRLEMTISDWLLKHDMLLSPWRFDFVGIVFDSSGGVSEIVHLPHVEL